MSTEAPTLTSVSLLIEDCLHATAPIVEDGYPLIRTPNIGRGRFDFDGVFRVDDETYEKWTRRAVPQDGDLILAREAPAGNVAIVKDGEKVCLGQRTVLIRPDPKKVDPDFLCYFLLAPRQQAFLLRGATGATAPHVNMKDIRRLPLQNLPKFEFQKPAGELLSTYDELIENNRRRMHLLEEAARLLYREWFVLFRFPGHEHLSVLDGVPQGWERKRLGDLCGNVRATVSPDDVDPETPYIGLEHMPRRSISLSEWETAAAVTSSKHRFKRSDILFGKIRSYLHKVGVTFCDGITSSDAIVIRPNGDELRGLVLMTVSSDHFIAVASTTAREGSKMPRADWKVMTNFPIALPPDSLLRTFADAIDPIVEQLRTLTFQNKKLRAARDHLLPRLMSGDMAVPGAS